MNWIGGCDEDNLEKKMTFGDDLGREGKAVPEGKRRDGHPRVRHWFVM